MNSNKTDSVIYLMGQLPSELKPLAANCGFIAETALRKEVNALGIQLYVVGLMQSQGERYSVLAGYHFGITKGFQSLTAITDQYLAGIDMDTNAIFIQEMHRAAQPFFAEMLVAPVSDVEAMAIELQRAHWYAVESLMSKVSQDVF